MRFALLLPAFLLSACGAGTVATLPVGTNTPVQTGGAAPVTSNASFAAALNGVRANVGAGAVVLDSRLDTAAQKFAEELVATNRFDHTGANGSTIATRAAAEGYVFTALGENIARGSTTDAAVMAQWQGSPLHRANNENAAFRDFGIGVAGTGSNTKWVLMLGAQ